LRAALAKAYRAFLPGTIPSETVSLAALHALAKRRPTRGPLCPQ
jgi:hypothetical protein